MIEPGNEKFSRRYRIVKSSDYRAIYETGRKVHSENFVLFGRANDLAHHRLGITVSRKIGGAVVRNRVKRLCREVFRRTRSGIPNHLDLVLNAKRGSSDAAFEILRQEFLSAVQRILNDLFE